MNKNDKKIEKRAKRNRIKKYIFALFVIAIILLDSQIYENGGGIRGIINTFFGKSEEKLENLNTIYVLVMGVSTDLEKELTDTIILCGYNPKQQKASMLSIPRDTFVGENENKAKGSDKINSLYSESPQETLKVVSEITGLEIPYYAVINTEALVQAVDILGGVEFNVPINMDYDDDTQDLHIHLKKGLQTLDGEKAEQLLRYRHSNPDKNGNMTTYPSEYGNDDYGRMHTQRDFIIATVSQALQVRDIGIIKDLISTVFDNLDTNLKLNMITPYVPYLIDFNVTNIQSLQLPGVSKKLNNLWFFVCEEEETSSLIEQMKNRLDGIETVIEDGNTINENITNTSIVNKVNVKK